MGRVTTYAVCTMFPTLANTGLDRLYDDRSRDRMALTSIGR